MDDRILEVCCYTTASALIAQQAGAHRIEFCDNYFEGGTTPSFGNLHWAIEHISLPIFPIIRPRGGHFVYSDTEIEIIKKEIKYCRQLGFEGIVTGALTKTGTIDYKLTANICEWAWPMEVTFHRAFDRVQSPFEALEVVIEAGCTRVLTSGQFPTALLGMNILQNLLIAAKEQIIVMPGGGIRASNLGSLLQNLPAKEFHTSALTFQPEPYFSPESMAEKLVKPTAELAEITQMLDILKRWP